MKRSLFSLIVLLISVSFSIAQGVFGPEQLLQIGRVSALGISKDGKELVYRVSIPSIENDNSTSRYYAIALTGGIPREINNQKVLLADKNVSPDGKYVIYHEAVKVLPVKSADFYPDFDKANAYIYDALDHRHWDHWTEGKYNHVFVKENKENAIAIDIMAEEPYHSPQMPFGGDEDYIWSSDSKSIIYVSKKKFGTDAVVSTNTDLYSYDMESGVTTNLTPGLKGYDTHPDFSPKGELTWLSMARDGYEADKNDIMIMRAGMPYNLTSHWDGTVDAFKWSADGKYIYFLAATGGTKQLFRVDDPGLTKKMPVVEQLTDGVFDVSDIVGFSGNLIIVGRRDMNHAVEYYTYDLQGKKWNQLTKVNDDFYKKYKPAKIEKRMVKTSDNKDMVVWVVYPPDFDPNKKYPTLLYCQGGPQSALTQFFSFRWNFRLMASQGYIVVAPNRRGMPGHGVEWNEQISGDWGGQVMRDYLSAIDDIITESYVDKERLAAVGASFGGYSVFQLAGMHNKRFKSFISHCGVFDLRSMYGTTEEIFFVNFDLGGPYWDKGNSIAQRSYEAANPVNFVKNWDTPILIFQGGKDYRVPKGQALAAHTAAQLQGIKSRLVYFPEENHWILKNQNAMVWHNEFFRWLKETL